MRPLAIALALVVACLLGIPISVGSWVSRQGAEAASLSPRAGEMKAARVSPRVGAARVGAGKVSPHAGLRLQLSVGYHNIYRGEAWTPVRITVRNNRASNVHGVLEIPQADASATGAQPDFHGLYQAPVTIPAGAAKNVTLYVPGSGVQGSVSVRLRAGNRVLATAAASPVGLDTSALLIGVLTGDPRSMAWIGPGIQRQVTTHIIRLTPATVDAVPDALATFDIIVLTNVDTSQLDRAQLAALERYVRNGGSLLLVGGPSWQETLRPLGSALLPGSLKGTRTLPDLHGLRPLISGGGSPPRQAAAVSVLSGAGGGVMAGQAGVPLVVRESEGQGSIEYLAFDPALDPVADWTGAPDLTERLVAMAAPLAISRTWSPTAFRARFQRLFQSAALTDELSNFPSLPVPFLVLFAALTLGYLLILGPVNFVLLRRIRRLSLAWVTVPVLGLTYLLSIFAIASHIRASSAVLNTVGVLTLDGSPDARPATFYMGLATPMSGDYHVTYRSAGLPAPLPELDRSSFSFRNASMLHATPLRMRIQEDPQTAVTFMAMRRWTVRDLSFDTSIPVPGGVQSTLTIDSQGDLTGSIRNGTNLDLVDPIIVAGQNVAHLPTILAGRSVHARVRPGAPDFSQRPGSILVESYGGNDLLDTGGFGGFDDCCDPAYPQERTLIDRVRNAASMLAQAQPDVLPALGEVMLVGWTQRPLEAVSVDGSTPQRRDLTLVVAPLSVRFPIQGPFRLRTGTIGSHVVDILPRAPQSSCCSFGFGFGRGPQQQQVTLGAGGFMTFEFDLHGARRLRFGRLAVSVNNQDSGTSRGRVYDWSAHRWVAVDLSSGSASLRNPNRFVSSRGQILVRLVGSSDDDLTLLNPDHDVQIAGAGDVA